MQYRIDSRNLIHFLKNTIKYDTSDLRDVVISRLLKDAEKAFENEQMMDLSEEEIQSESQKYVNSDNKGEDEDISYYSATLR